MRRILDVKYEKADLDKVVIKKYQHLSPDEFKRLLSLLGVFQDISNGTLGTWNEKLVKI